MQSNIRIRPTRNNEVSDISILQSKLRWQRVRKSLSIIMYSVGPTPEIAKAKYKDVDLATDCRVFSSMRT